ncbi:triple tyrosine motif-containing protein [Leeuwenhoekiella parthenopeia]|uniref:LuxR family transcriptional regulator n=1 Tax=Leeuwenhoekiella parthenopeia TaxID=2890320 RepID=A0ABS8GUY4_9FLAO|nr:triple tyrosine motif-containing protein [Leeuwenhoekiella parthenopeia]MCC4213777.1 LuxR family transcriptional regulator [Leeuwenhoekiella parthenopeia]
MRFLYFIFCFILFLPAMIGQELPPVQNFSPEEYAAENQNWAITQGANDFIYVANNSGLLEYDGARWRVYDSPNKTIIRAVEASGNRIYTGAYMEFGYWEPNRKGLLEYHSLSSQKELQLVEDEQFWNIFTIDNLVLFQSLNRIYSYDTQNQSLETFSPRGNITKAFRIDKSVYFQLEGQGLFQLQEGKAVLLSDAEFLKSDVLVGFFKSESRYIMIMARSGFFSLKNDEVSTLTVPQSVQEAVIYSCQKLRDGSLMLGTISSGLIHLDEAFNFDYVLNQQRGITNNTVLSIEEDRDANVWLGLDNGISVINSSTAFKVFRDNAGNLGSVYTSARVGDYLYLGTNQGLFYRTIQDKTSNYQLIPGTKGQVWSLTKIGDDLFCGHHEGTFLVDKAQVKQLARTPGTWQVQWLSKAQGLAIQGNYSGLYVLQNTANGWQLRNKISGFDISSRYFGLGPNQTIYVSHEYKGVFKVSVNENFTSVRNYELIPELPPAEKAGITPYKDRLFYVSNAGVYELDKQTEAFQLDSLLTRSFFETGTYTTGKLTYDDANDRLWSFNSQEISYLKPGILADEFEINRFALPAKARRDIPGFENITPVGANVYLLGNSTGYTLFDLNEAREEGFSIRLRGVENGTRDGKLQYIDQDNREPYPNEQSNFRFMFSVPQYDKFRAVVYQYRLQGYYEEWSAWSPEALVSYENLPHGDYVFEVRARIGESYSENTLSYPFQIKRPWYLSILAIVCYVVLGLLLIAGIQIYNRRYYRKQKQRLIEINNRRIELANSEKQREIIRLENEKLQQDVDSKSRELAASTMNLVKKNELLNTIKKELEQTEQKNTKTVIKIIDNNLDPKKDWEFFKEAFNNADKDFLKKIKRLHPKLTPNDLKLCAYLRLNLTSKEIAPLLNISVRSVEIKRYRLRKKMDLEREDGLVEYILSI